MPTGYHLVEDYVDYRNPYDNQIYRLQIGGPGRDQFNPPPSNIRLVQFGGAGDDFYNVGTPSDAQIAFTLRTGKPWATEYHAGLANRSWPAGVTYGAQKIEYGRHDEAHYGWGVDVHVSPGATAFFHSYDPKGANGVGNAIFWFHPELKNHDRIHLDDTDNSVSGDGFVFRNAVYSHVDKNTIDLRHIEVTAYSVLHKTQTTILMTHDTHLPGDKGIHIDVPDHNRDGDISASEERAAIQAHANGWVGDSLL